MHFTHLEFRNLSKEEINRLLLEKTDFTVSSKKKLVDNYFYLNNELYKNNTIVKLTQKEKTLINYLLCSEDTDYDSIMKNVWGKKVPINSITSIVKNIRNKTTKNFILNKNNNSYIINKEIS